MCTFAVAVGRELRTGKSPAVEPGAPLRLTRTVQPPSLRLRRLLVQGSLGRRAASTVTVRVTVTWPCASVQGRRAPAWERPLTPLLSLPVRLRPGGPDFGRLRLASANLANGPAWPGGLATATIRGAETGSAVPASGLSLSPTKRVTWHLTRRENRDAQSSGPSGTSS